MPSLTSGFASDILPMASNSTTECHCEYINAIIMISFQSLIQCCTPRTKHDTGMLNHFVKWMNENASSVEMHQPSTLNVVRFPCSFFSHSSLITLQLPFCGYMFHLHACCPWQISAVHPQCSLASASFPSAPSLNNVPYAFFKVYWSCSLESALYLKWRIWKYGDH